MEQDWIDLDQAWELPEEVQYVPDEGLVEFEDEFESAGQGWQGYFDGLDESDPEHADEALYYEWDPSSPDAGGYLYPSKSMPSDRLGLGFVLTCALIVGAALSLVLYKATAGVTFPILSAAPESSAEQAGDAFQSQVDEAGLVADSSGSQNGVCAVSDRYPAAILQWCSLITHYANKHGLPPDLIASLIWQESGGNPAAYSHSGAVGLMQVMPRDGLAASFMCKNGPCFSTRPTTEQLKDPEFNIAYGTRMLADLLRRSGSFREALRSYGPMNVGYYYADKVMGLFQTYGKSSP